MAFQDITATKLGQAAVTTSYATLYTVGASKRALLKTIDVCNTTASDILIYLHLVPSGGSAGTTNALFYMATIAAYGNLQYTGCQVMNPGDFISVKASLAGCTITASGGEAV